MPATRQNLRIEQGVTFTFVVDVLLAGVAANLTGFTAEMTVRRYRKDSTVLATYATEGGTITVNPGTGQVIVKVPDEETATYDWSDGEYDLVLKAGTGEKYRLLEGRVIVSPSVTA